MIHTCSYLKDHRGVLMTGLALLSMALAPRPAWGQWNGTNPVWTNSNVGIGTTIPSYALSLGNAGSDVQHTVALYENPGGANLFGFEFPFSGVNRVAVVVNGSERMSVLINGNVGI